MASSQTKYRKNVFNHSENIIMLKSTNNDGIVPHCHEFIELVYVSSGKGIHSIKGKSFIVSAGDLFIICTQDKHSLLPIDGQKTSFEWINCIFLPEFIQFDFSCFSPECRYIGAEGFEMNYIFNTMLQEFTDKKPGYLDILRNYLSIVLIKLTRLMQIENKDEKYSDIKKQQNLKKVIEYIHLNYQENISLKEIASHLNASPSYVCKIFNELKHISPVNYINQYRIEQSCKLLACTNFPIYRIAEETGFKDIKFYYSFFKRKMGIRPGEFRSKYTQAAKN